MAAAPPGMVIIDIDTVIGVAIKQGRLQASGIDAKVFDPSAGGYTRSLHSPSTRNCQLLVATGDAQPALEVLAIDASHALDDADFGGNPAASIDAGERWEPRTHQLFRSVVRFAGVLVLAGFAVLFVLSVASILQRM